MSDHGTLIPTEPLVRADARLDQRRRFGSLFDAPRAGRVGVVLPPLDVPAADPAALYGKAHRPGVEGEVEASEVDVVRHFTRLSQMNFSIDTALYSLGSCTMKHNPRLNEKMARLPGFADVHPLQPVSTVQGALELIRKLAHVLMTMTGMKAVAMTPKAGAHGELCGMMAIKAALAARG
ncbi:MAG: aminomethyl-transferring glycine dehydrogenase subunit GcvPB, partial [Thermoanaerobaculia bacterium]